MISSFFSQVWGVLSGYRFLQDSLDILFVTFLIYEAVKFIRQTRSIQIVKGIALICLLYVGILIFDMPVSKFIFQALFASAIVVCVVLFQPEIRNGLEHMGRSKLSRVFGFNFKQNRENMIKSYKRTIDSVCSACAEMSDNKIGALIVFERETNLGDIESTGTVLDARVSADFVRNVFYPKAPLHDGAIIIKDNRVCAAGCILPLTESHNLNPKYGTRHRAAIGITEQSDAIVAVVSEETGNISIVENGFMDADISDGDLREILTEKLIRPLSGEQSIGIKKFLPKKKGKMEKDARQKKDPKTTPKGGDKDE